MFQYFPTNYVWSLSAMIAITHGGQIGEVDEMCAPLRDAALAGDDPGTQAFFAAWKGGADKLAALADEDLRRGRALSAGEKLGRAALYYGIAERMLSQSFEARRALYERSLAVFREAVTLARENCERIEIPYEGRHLAALHVRAVGARGPAPLVVVMNGLDSTKEMLYRSCLADYLSRRGLSALFVDQPGTGEALRLQGFHAVPNTETWAARIIDYLETRDDVDAARIAALGVSLGGYYAPRAVAFEPRFAAGAVWGANHDWREVQKRRLAKEGENPVPHYWQHVEWVFGASGIEDFMQRAEAMHLDGVLERIKVPFLVTHGENDRQIPLQYAHRSYEQLVNSPARELKIFTAREGGVEHSSLDNATNAGNYISDWLAEQLGGSTA